MFAPYTTHFTRTLPTAHPTTRRKLQVHDENNKNVLPSKTPSRTTLTGKAAVLANTGGPAARVGLGLAAKTEGRDRNVLGRTPAAGDGEGKGKGKGKAGAGEDIAPKRLFANPKLAPSTSFSSLQPIIHARTHQRSGSTFGPSSSSTSIAPLGASSKTPARAAPTARKAGGGNGNLRTPAPSTFRIARDSPAGAGGLDEDDAPPVSIPVLPALATPLASAQRDRRRRSSTMGRSSLSLSGPHRLAGSGGSGPGPGEAGGSSGGVKQKEVKDVVYKTPAPHRRYREDEEEGEGEGDSLGDIQLAPEQLHANLGAEVGLDVLDEEEGEEESDGEVEYMPPKVHVPFDLGHEYRRFSLSDIYGPDSDPEDVAADGAGLLLTPELATFDLPDVTLCSVPDEDLEDPIFRSLRPSSPSGTVKPTQPTGSKPSTTTARSAFRTAHRLPTSSPSTAVQAQAGQGKSSIRAANAHAGGTAARALPKSNSVRFAAPVAPAAPVASAASRPAVASASAPTATSRARLAQGTTSSATSAAAPRRIAKPGLPTDALARKPAVPAAPLRGNTARDTIITARAGTSTGTASTRVSFQDRPRTRTQTQIRAQARSTSTGKADAVAGAKQVDDSAIWARQEILDDLGADGEADGEGLMLCLDSDPDEA